MSPPRGSEPLRFGRIGRAEIGLIAHLELEPTQSERFLGPLDDIAAAVRGGPVHLVMGISAGGCTVGFYVLHPDRRDAACWWLGWFALDRRHQGRGYGRDAMAHIVGTLRRIDRCRRVRLLVDGSNAPALRLYLGAGFRPVGTHRTGELVLEAGLDRLDRAVTAPAPAASTQPKRVRRKHRVRRPHGPHAAFCIGFERGPPCPAGAAPGGSSYPAGSSAATAVCQGSTIGSSRRPDPAALWLAPLGRRSAPLSGRPGSSPPLGRASPTRMSRPTGRAAGAARRASAPGAWRQVAQRLVEQDHLGTAHHRPPDRPALALPAGTPSRSRGPSAPVRSPAVLRPAVEVERHRAGVALRLQGAQGLLHVLTRSQAGSRSPHRGRRRGSSTSPRWRS